ncbi:MAG: PHP-associated domain-containing protein [Acidimicrobiia bacterium]
MTTEGGVPTSSLSNEVHPDLLRPRVPGRVRVDCHTHTCYSGDAVTTIEEFAAQLESLALDVVCVTDHHSVRGAYELRALGLSTRIVIGEEIRSREGEIIGLFLHERISPGMSLADTVQAIREQGGVTYVPHPFDPARRPLRTDALYAACANGWIDVIEVFNAKTADPNDNSRARDCADTFGVGMGAGSDAHDRRAIGAAYVELSDFDDPQSFLDAFVSAETFGQHFDPPREWTPRVIPKNLRPSS